MHLDLIPHRWSGQYDFFHVLLFTHSITEPHLPLQASWSKLSLIVSQIMVWDDSVSDDSVSVHAGKKTPVTPFIRKPSFDSLSSCNGRADVFTNFIQPAFSGWGEVYRAPFGFETLCYESGVPKDLLDFLMLYFQSFLRFLFVRNEIAERIISSMRCASRISRLKFNEISCEGFCTIHPLHWAFEMSYFGVQRIAKVISEMQRSVTVGAGQNMTVLHEFTNIDSQSCEHFSYTLRAAFYC